jgi:hypothetical protein
VAISRKVETNTRNPNVIDVSTIWISCVKRVIILAVGVWSSHLEKIR